MRHILQLLPILLVISCARQPLQETPLTSWQFQYQKQWLSTSAPGCIHTDLMAHGIIPDPFYATNEDSVQWVGDSAWTYRTVIHRNMWEGYEHCDLVLDGVTPCRIFISDPAKGDRYSRTIGICDNTFRQYRFDLSNAAYSLGDSNIITIQFYPIEHNNDKHFAISSHGNSQDVDMSYDLPDHRVMQRTPPYMLGWDWGPKLSTVGILQCVRLECHNGDLPTSQPSDPQSWNVTLQQQPDSIGQSFTFLKDGKPIFCKGANWIPCHSFPILTPALQERYRQLLTSAKEANFNMLRVWGGGIYEPDFFYDICDSLGIMVWQDFNFSCALYPSDSLFLDNVRQEALQQVSRLARHSCIVLWCGNNEIENGWQDWGWQKQYRWTDEQQALLRHGIDTLFGSHGILSQTVALADPLHRTYIPSSPLYGWGHPECVTHGDSHYWGVWWGEEPFEVYHDKTGRFMSEYGFQSYPDYSTVCRYAPASERTILSPTLLSHQKHPRGREIIDKAMLRYYGLDSRTLSLEDYCYVSQLLQAWGTGYGILQHLLAQPHCMGTLYWQLNDCWPVASWSSIDYYGNWKALHYRARDLFADDADLKQWEAYYSIYPRDIHLDSTSYTLSHHIDTAGHLTVIIQAHTSLRDIMLQTNPHVDGRFSDNYFDIPAGQSRTVTFLPANPTADLSQVQLSVKCLNDLIHTNTSQH